MGWTAWYQLLRDRKLSDEEKRALGELVRRVNEKPWDSESFGLGLAPDARPDRVLAQGWNKLGMNLDESPDARRLVDALNQALDLVPGAEIRVSDDFKAFGWDAAARRVELSAKPTAPLLDVPGSALVDAVSFAPAIPLPADLAALVGGDRPITDASVIEKVLAMLEKLDGNDAGAKVLEQVLARCDKDKLARAALPRYGTLGRKPAWRVVQEALNAVSPVEPLVPAFLDIWCRSEGLYWHHDMYLGDAFEERLAADPTVVKRLEQDITSVEGPDELEERLYRRAERAIPLLARRRNDRALAFLLSLVKRARERKMHWQHDFNVRHTALRALAAWGDARCFATFAVELGRMTDGQAIIHPEMTASMVRTDPGRARPIVTKLAEVWALGSRIVEPLAILRDTAGLQRVLPALVGWERTDAIRRLRELGVTVPAAQEADPPYESLVLHPSRELRQAALRKIHERKDPKTFYSLVLAEAVDAELRARSKDSSLPFSWWTWKELLPEKAPQASISAKMGWAQGEGRARLGEQVIWDSVRSVHEKGTYAVTKPIPDTLFRLSKEERDAFLAEEGEVLRRLG